MCWPSWPSSYMILRAVHKQPGSFVAPLQDIFSWDRHLNDVSFTHRLATSVSNKGMLNPILVMTLEGYLSTEQDPSNDSYVDHTKPYICMIGNNRYLYALRNGYTSIECLIVDDPVQLRLMTHKLLIKPRKM